MWRALLALALVACHNPRPSPSPSPAPVRDDAGELRGLMAHYDELTAHLDADGIAAMYVPDGELVNNGEVSAHGATAIHDLLASFRGAIASVEAKTTLADVHVDGDHAHITGTFAQHVVLATPDAKAIDAHGRFACDWIRTPAGWRLVRMETLPDQ